MWGIIEEDGIGACPWRDYSPKILYTNSVAKERTTPVKRVIIISMVV
jgi:hypothetical protein